MRTKLTARLLVFALVLAATPAPARSATADAPDSPPSPTVARLSLVQSGSVTITRGDNRERVEASLNAPLLPGDGFATTGENARAEIQLDGMVSLRLGGVVHGRIAANDVHERRIDVSSGSVELAVLRGTDLPTEIVTPQLTLRARYAGAYRIAVEDGITAVTVRSGQADAIVPPKTYTIVAGKTLEARIWAGQSTVAFRAEIARDDFDAFNDARDRALLGALDDTHVPAALTGYDDFASYGSWTQEASYGQVWVPTQNSDWAPYRDGAWSYEGGYGWTWVGAEPWGWVPYHFGRWIHLRRFGWCWVPPPLGLSPIWAPGLVGFFDYGFGAFGYSGVGWVPLAPYEPWYPWGLWGSNRQRPAPPKKMLPLATAFHNAQFGGATTVGAGAWREGNFTHPAAIDPARVSSVRIIAQPEQVMPMPATPSHATPVTAASSALATQGLTEEIERAEGILTAPRPPAIPALTPVMHAPVTRTTLPGTHETAPVSHGTLTPATAHTTETPPIVHGTLAPPIVHPPEPPTHETIDRSGSFGSTRPPA